MHATQHTWQAGTGWQHYRSPPNREAQAVFAFGAPGAINESRLDELRAMYPKAEIAACTTGGEIFDRQVQDDSISVLALAFDDTRVASAQTAAASSEQAYEAGQHIASALDTPDLKAVFVLSDGLVVNGSALVRGLKSRLGEHIVITGGLAGDGDRFSATRVGLNGELDQGRVIALGFSGDSIRVSHGSSGGWDSFGPERLITKSDSNVLFELDGLPALDLYKRYLGDEARDLPGSALLFPLRIYDADQEESALVRTIVGIDEERRAMIFAGDMPEGKRARLMKGSFDHLVQGAQEAGQQAKGAAPREQAALLVSCIGRKLLFGQRASSEIEAVADALGPGTCLSGFYSYGEICPQEKSGFCELHNQTMTVTTFWETDRG